MPRMGSLNVTLPEHSDHRLLLWMSLLMLAGEFLDNDFMACQSPPRFDTVDCERVCYGHIERVSLTECVCRPYQGEGE